MHFMTQGNGRTHFYFADLKRGIDQFYSVIGVVLRGNKAKLITVSIQHNFYVYKAQQMTFGKKYIAEDRSSHFYDSTSFAEHIYLFLRPLVPLAFVTFALATEMVFDRST